MKPTEPPECVMSKALSLLILDRSHLLFRVATHGTAFLRWAPLSTNGRTLVCTVQELGAALVARQAVAGSAAGQPALFLHCNRQRISVAAEG